MPYGRPDTVRLDTLEKSLQEFSSVARKVSEIGRTVECLSTDVSSLENYCACQMTVYIRRGNLRIIFSAVENYCAWQMTDYFWRL